MSTSTPLLVFAGSTRTGSWNRQLAGAVSDMATAEGAQVTRIELADFDVPMYNADLEAKGTPRDVVRLKEIFYAHPAWLVCSPEYNGSYTGLLEKHHRLGVQPHQGRPRLEPAAPSPSPARWSVCWQHRPARWAAFAASATSHRC